MIAAGAQAAGGVTNFRFAGRVGGIVDAEAARGPGWMCLAERIVSSRAWPT